MSFDFVADYLNVVILGICVCVGYIVKNGIPSEKINRFIPMISGALGVALAIWSARGISPEVVLTGLISGLAATGAYEAFKNVISKN